MICRWRIVATLALASLAASAAEPTIAERYAGVSSDFIEQLDVLADKCDTLDLAPQAETTRAWTLPRKSGRLIFFFSEPTASDTLPSTASQRVQQWHARFMELRRKYADEVFGLAAEAAHDHQGELALRLIHEVIHEDPHHEEAQRILGLKRSVMRASKPRAPADPHPKFGWKGGRHWTIDSRHFTIESNHSPKACSDLAGELEQLHDVWRQLFFPVWGKNEPVAGRFSGQDVDLVQHKRFRVVLFKDRDEYLRQLTKGQKNIGVSSGIYFDEQKTSIFFAGPEAKKSTWYHEATHQLFQEYLEAPPGVAKENNVWLVEAAALFMESMVLGDGCAMLGGYDADNLQFARFRARGGDFQMPLAELSALGRDALQEHSDIRKIYGQIGGLGHFFLEGRDGGLRNPFLKSLVAVYQGRATTETLTAAVGQVSSSASEVSYDELDKEYYAFLDVTDAMIARTPPHPTIRGLSLRKTSITDARLASFARCDQLQWLDLSLTRAGDAGFAVFPASKSLKKLFLEHTRVTDEALEHVARFAELEELYLSATAITDEGIAKLPGLKKLKLLDLAGCNVTDACAPSLAQMKQLESLDVSGTKMSSAALIRLKKSLPKLKESPGN